MAGARPHRAEPGAPSRPTKGGAVRIRIALTTAVAVIAIPVVLFALFSSTPAASARVTGHEAISQHGAVKINLKLMSYAEAQKVAKMATFYNAVTAHQEATYFADLAFFKAVAVQQQQQAAAQAAAAAAAAARPGGSGCGGGSGSGASCGTGRGTGRRCFGCNEHRHGRLGLHPPARVRWQLRRGWWWRLPVRGRDVDECDRLAGSGPVIPRCDAGRGRIERCTPSAAGRPGPPATSAGCEDRAVDGPRRAGTPN